MDITAMKNAFEEIRILRDQLYKENLALRKENLRLGQIGPTPGILMLRERIKPINSRVLDLVQRKVNSSFPRK